MFAIDKTCQFSTYLPFHSGYYTCRRTLSTVLNSLALSNKLWLWGRCSSIDANVPVLLLKLLPVWFFFPLSHIPINKQVHFYNQHFFQARICECWQSQIANSVRVKLKCGDTVPYKLQTLMWDVLACLVLSMNKDGSFNLGTWLPGYRLVWVGGSLHIIFWCCASLKQ